MPTILFRIRPEASGFGKRLFDNSECRFRIVRRLKPISLAASTRISIASLWFYILCASSALLPSARLPVSMRTCVSKIV